MVKVATFVNSENRLHILWSATSLLVLFRGPAVSFNWRLGHFPISPLGLFPKLFHRIAPAPAETIYHTRPPASGVGDFRSFAFRRGVILDGEFVAEKDHSGAWELVELIFKDIHNGREAEFRILLSEQQLNAFYDAVAEFVAGLSRNPDEFEERVRALSA
jgi:hypothetical protein